MASDSEQLKLFHPPIKVELAHPPAVEPIMLEGADKPEVVKKLAASAQELGDIAVAETFSTR
ncbi:MAG: hypothetical protein WD877_00065 [Candidatus Saccharimonadales bacterium]